MVVITRYEIKKSFALLFGQAGFFRIQDKYWINANLTKYIYLDIYSKQLYMHLDLM
jgi:hypothetical protein